MASLKEVPQIEVTLTPGRKGQFEVLAGGESLVKRGGNWFTRQLGAGYPDTGEVVALLKEKMKGTSS